jgi:hypothetical protein
VVLVQGSPAHVDTPGRQPVVVGSPAVVANAVNGIPATVLSAYRAAVVTLTTTEPACRIPVDLLAGIGKVESGHARGGRVSADGTALRPILGPVLDGTNGSAAIADTDGGALDGDTTWDRAVGPMQFIPSTWRGWASDGNRDGRADPENVFDAALAAARYLCAGGRDLSTGVGVDAAILSYNNSTHYLRLVLAWMNDYSGAVAEVADVTSPTGGTVGVVTVPLTTPSTVVGTPPRPTTTSTVIVSPPTTIAAVPVPTTLATPTTTAVPTRPVTTPPAVPADPVTGLLCGVGDVLGGLLGGLLGGGHQPPPGNDCGSTDTDPKG